MFTCKKSVHLLREFLDGELEADEEQHLREHLSQCPPCVDFLRTYQVTPDLCRRAMERKMPQVLADKLTEFIKAKCKK